jgi:hypothetical protein
MFRITRLGYNTLFLDNDVMFYSRLRPSTAEFKQASHMPCPRAGDPYVHFKLHPVIKTMNYICSREGGPVNCNAGMLYTQASAVQGQAWNAG